jgi:16S rRNA (guanine527-N7)-methyltransferase
LLYAIAVDLERRIVEGLEYFGIEASRPALDGLCTYVRELDRWNRRVNVTGKKDMDSMVGELLYDAFFLHGWTHGEPSLLDVGSGAGIPGIPLAILRPELRVTSVDSSLKKVQFQRHVRRTLQMENLFVVHGRIEEIEPLGVDAMTAKAFGLVEHLLDAGIRHLNPGGRAFLLRGKDGTMPVHQGFLPERDERYVLPGGRKEYRLFVYKRVP